MIIYDILFVLKLYLSKKLAYYCRHYFLRKDPKKNLSRMLLYYKAEHMTRMFIFMREMSQHVYVF